MTEMRGEKKHYTTHKASYKHKVEGVSDETPIVTKAERELKGNPKSMNLKVKP